MFCVCQGSRLSNLHQIALCGFCSLKAFCTALEDENENGGLPVFNPGTESSGPHFSVYPRKIIESFLSPCSLSTLHGHRAYDHAFLSQAYNPILNSPNPEDSCDFHWHYFSRTWWGCLTGALLLTGRLVGEQLVDHAVFHSLWHPQDESPLLGSLIETSFPVSMTESSATLQPQSFCYPENPVIHCPTEDSTLLCYLSTFLCDLSSDILPRIYFSAPPTLQKLSLFVVAAVLFLDLWLSLQVFRMFYQLSS